MYDKRVKRQRWSLAVRARSPCGICSCHTYRQMSMFRSFLSDVLAAIAQGFGVECSADPP